MTLRKRGCWWLERIAIAVTVSALGWGADWSRQPRIHSGPRFSQYDIIAVVLRRFYVNNFRCLENFDLPVRDHSSVLLIGKNGSGKSTVFSALEVLQQVARGKNRAKDLVLVSDFFLGRSSSPIRFEIEALVQERVYKYKIAFELPEGFRELRILEESLSVGDEPVFDRQIELVTLHRGTSSTPQSAFRLDWHLVALPAIQTRASTDPVAIFKDWLARILILRPIPSRIKGLSTAETLAPDKEMELFASWWAGVMAHSPSAYNGMETFLKRVMPDLKVITNPSVGPDLRQLEVCFSSDGPGVFKTRFDDLSDGEKCLMIGALVLASHKAYGPLVCCWDEPDNYLAASEISHFMVALNKTLALGGQLIAASHNRTAIQQFFTDNTYVLDRPNHLEPTQLRALKDLDVQGDPWDALVLGDLAA